MADQEAQAEKQPIDILDLGPMDIRRAEEWSDIDDFLNALLAWAQSIERERRQFEGAQTYCDVVAGVPVGQEPLSSEEIEALDHILGCTSAYEKAKAAHRETKRRWVKRDAQREQAAAERRKEKSVVDRRLHLARKGNQFLREENKRLREALAMYQSDSLTAGPLATIVRSVDAIEKIARKVQDRQAQMALNGNGDAQMLRGLRGVTDTLEKRRLAHHS